MSLIDNSLKQFSIYKRLLNDEQIESDQKQNMNRSKYDKLLYNFLQCYRSNNNSQQSKQTFKQLLSIINETKSKINIQSIISQMSTLKILVVESQMKIYNLKEQINQLSKSKQLSKVFKNKQQSKIFKNKQQPKSIRFNSEDNHEEKQERQSLNKNNHSNFHNSFKQNYRAIVLYGKAMNIYKKSKQSKQLKLMNKQNPVISSIASQLQQWITYLYQQKCYPYVKSQPHSLQDLLLTHSFKQQPICPILVSNQVYQYFIPLDFCIILVYHENQSIKSDSFNFIKSSLLHVYSQYYKVLDKIMHKQTYLKNYTFKGIYFIQQGEVQTKSNRIVAKGWVINGKCKTITTCWKFKPISFFKFILHDQNIYKQFINDIKLNDQYPFLVQDILNLDQKISQDIKNSQYYQNQIKINKNKNNKKIKLPSINHINSTNTNHNHSNSIDNDKLTQLMKMRHYDQKIDSLSHYKQQIFKKKSQYSKVNTSQIVNLHISKQGQQEQLKKKIDFLSQKYSLQKRQPQKRLKRTDTNLSLSHTSQSSTFLVNGVLKKLKFIHQSSDKTYDYVLPITQISQISQFDKKNIRNSFNSVNQKQQKQSKQKNKILGWKRYEEILKQQKNHKFKGKNKYK